MSTDAVTPLRHRMIEDMLDPRRHFESLCPKGLSPLSPPSAPQREIGVVGHYRQSGRPQRIRRNSANPLLHLLPKAPREPFTSTISSRGPIASQCSLTEPPPISSIPYS